MICYASNSVKGAAAASLYLIGQATETLDNPYMQAGIQTFSDLYDVASIGMMVYGGLQIKPGSLGKFKGTDALRAENAVARDAARAAGLSKDQQKILHREISGQGFDYKQILEKAKQIKIGNW